jgi:hypothetical protein
MPKCNFWLVCPSLWGTQQTCFHLTLCRWYLAYYYPDCIAVFCNAFCYPWGRELHDVWQEFRRYVLAVKCFISGFSSTLCCLVHGNQLLKVSWNHCRWPLISLSIVDICTAECHGIIALPTWQFRVVGFWSLKISHWHPSLNPLPDQPYISKHCECSIFMLYVFPTDLSLYSWSY